MRKQQPKTPEEIFDDNRALVYHIARRVKIPEEEREDMIQEGLLALWRASQGFDPDAGFKFSTYAGTAITRAMVLYAYKSWHRNHLTANSVTYKRAYKAAQGKEPMRPGYERLIQDFVSLDSKAFDDDSDTTIADLIACEDDYSYIYCDSIRDEVISALKTLTPDQREAVVRCWGLDGHEPMTQQEVADELGVTHGAIYFRVKSAQKKLRKTLGEPSNFA